MCRFQAPAAEAAKARQRKVFKDAGTLILLLYETNP
jgi:hypothetical protein